MQMQNKIKPYEKLKVLSDVVYVCENRNFEKIGLYVVLYYIITMCVWR
jgi:hypothetical protein